MEVVLLVKKQKLTKFAKHGLLRARGRYLFSATPHGRSRSAFDQKVRPNNESRTEDQQA